MKPTVKCPECYSTELYKYGKDKHSNQKYLCKRYKMQFTRESGKNIKYYLKFTVCGKVYTFIININIMLVLNVIIP